MEWPTPERWHAKRHRRPDLPVADCWQCQRDRAKCRSKIPFHTWEEADEWVTDFNRNHPPEEAQTRYRCRWCPCWHMCTVKTWQQRKRAERARRKTLWRRP